MPLTKVLVYREASGKIPFTEWLTSVKTEDKRAYAKILARILLLGNHGYELQRPMSDTLRDGVKELRIRRGNVNYRVLYFFHGQNVAILSHGIIKESVVPGKEIDAAIRHHSQLQKNPKLHTAQFLI